ncbi:hypothetical protein B0H10DRAFT_717281 [Mycena sp. CBHHK59/15]|nr:hypothetical protein B0H10DRAFT_717281 [Mycena sp. CBHHK59/15]
MKNAKVPCQYRTGKTLSSGTYAIVKEAIQIRTGKYYACKVINKNLMEGREHMVRNEISVRKRISGGHPSIVKLYDCFETSHNVYLCFDLCTGGQLVDRVHKKGSYSESDAADLVRTIFSGVKYIHDVGIVHRDLNPESLLFRTPADDAQIMIADFGASRIMEERLTLLTDTRGTLAYMAPEILRNKGHGKPVDIWAMGVVSYFLLAGCTPFDRGTPKVKKEAIIAGDYNFQPDMDVSDTAYDFVNLCLTVDPERRPTAAEALEHKWLASSRPALTKRTSSSSVGQISLMPSVKKAFNAKKLWRKAVFMIEAVNRMTTLARHSIPRTQWENEDSKKHTQDASAVRSHESEDVSEPSEDSESAASDLHTIAEDEEPLEFPSPVSSVYSNSDQASWITNTSGPAADYRLHQAVATGADLDTLEEMPDDTSPQEYFDVQSMYGNSEQESGDTNNESPTHADARISTFVIYTPNEVLNEGTPVRPGDAELLETKFPEGGVIVSVHIPTQAEAWLEAHYDDPLLESIRSRGLGGPVAAMLSPDVPTLAIFGSILDDWVLEIAKTLSDVAGFAVMVRPLVDNPIPNFAHNTFGEASLDQAAAKWGEDPGSQIPGDANTETEVTTPIDSSNTDSAALRIRGGQGDEIWCSKAHRAVVWLHLWPDEKRGYSLSVNTKTTFQIQPEYPTRNPSETQPEVIGRVEVHVETPLQVLPDRSYTCIGFLVHKERSVSYREFIDCGYDHPDQTLKDVTQKTTQKTGTMNIGSANAHATGGVGASYSKTLSRTVEKTDNKPMPRCTVGYVPGSRWNKDGKSYTSYDITTVPGDDPRASSGSKHPLKAEFGIGINIWESKKDTGLPKMSFITRNQAILWISEPALKSKVRGLLVLTTTYIPDIQTHRCLSIEEDLEVHFASGFSQSMDPEAMAADFPMSVSIAPTLKPKQNTLGHWFPDIRAKFVTPPQEPTLAYLPLQQYISRGWDATNETWRDTLWTSLDKDFRNSILEKTDPVWRMGWKAQGSTYSDSGESSEEEERDDAGVVSNKGKGKEREHQEGSATPDTVMTGLS